MSNEPTPRTDAFQSSGEAHYMACDFARKLERELAQSQEANAGLMKACDALERELAEVTKQRDRLAEALRVSTAYPLSESWYKQAMEALATLKPCD